MKNNQSLAQADFLRSGTISQIARDIVKTQTNNRQLNERVQANWQDWAIPLVDNTIFDDGSGNQPSVTLCRVCLFGGLCFVHLEASGYKRTTGNQTIKIANTQLPTINEAEYLSNYSCMGNCHIKGSSGSYPGPLFYSLADHSFENQNDSIADNLQLVSVSFMITYEV
jgi:hypothetical protein